MKKLKMVSSEKLTFEEGCNKYLEYCRQRNLRQDSIRHYRQSALYFFKYFDKNMPVENIDENTYKNMEGEPQYTNREGVVTHIDDAGQIYGTCPEVDTYIIVKRA